MDALPTRKGSLSARPPARLAAPSPAAELARLVDEGAAAIVQGTRPHDPSHFIEFVVRLVRCVDTTRDRRAVLLECRRLLRVARQDSHRLQAAFEAGEFPAIDYVALGEISAAGDLVRLQLAAQRSIPNPYAPSPVVHLSIPRIGMFLDSRRDLLGDAVFDRIAAHVRGCPACRGAARSRRRPARTTHDDAA